MSSDPKQQYPLGVILTAFRDVEMPLLVVNEAGTVMGGSKLTGLVWPGMVPEKAGQNLAALMDPPPEVFSDWLVEARFSKTVRFREPSGVLTPPVLVNAYPLGEDPLPGGYWLLNLHPVESLALQQAQREVLLRISSLPIPELMEECRPISATGPRNVIIADLLEMIVTHLGGAGALLFRRGEGTRLEPIGAHGLPPDALQQALASLAGRPARSAGNQYLLEEAAGTGFTFSLGPQDEPDETLAALAADLPFACHEIWIDGVAGFGTGVTFFSAPPSRSRRQFATDAYVRLGRHLESATYGHRMYEAYLELQETQEKIIQASKMSALGEMATGMAHELRQPITAITNFLSSIFDQIETERFDRVRNRLDEYRTRSQRNLDRMTGIIDHLRTFARPDAMNFQPINLETFFAEIHSTFLVTGVQRKDLKVVWDLPKDLPEIEMDAARIEQVLLNLISNARDAIEDSPHPLIRIAASVSDGQLRLSVSDNGPGIPAEHMDKLFDLFFSTKKVGQGTGMGLSISHSIVRSHQGEIACANLPGGGASFTIFLPVTQPRPH